jgi:hypothetical protein
MQFPGAKLQINTFKKRGPVLPVSNKKETAQTFETVSFFRTGSFSAIMI